MSTKIDLYLGLGSNLGDRRGNLLEALKRLDAGLGVSHDAVSDFVETEPWGFDSDDRFLNAVVRYALDVPCGTDMPRKWAVQEVRNMMQMATGSTIPE